MKPEPVEEKVLDEVEAKFLEFYLPKVQGVTESAVTREQSGRVTVEWLWPRLVIYRPSALTAADGLNGVEFAGAVRVEAAAVRRTVRGADGQGLGKGPGLPDRHNGEWVLPERAGLETYAIRRVKGEWGIEPWRSGWDSAYRGLRVHWLCGQPRPEAVPVDEAKLKAECLAAFGKVRRATEGGFALRYLGYDEPVRQAPVGSKVKVHDLLVEYRGFGEAKLEAVRVDAAERANGLEARFLLREWDGARVVREASVRELRDGEVKPRLRCSSPGVEVSSEWADLKLLLLTAEQVGGVWRFSDGGAGEAVGE